MSATSRSRRSVPHSAPAYYLGRPASVWISVTSGHAGAPEAGGGGHLATL
jgi:hypothetical protein